VPVCGPKPRGVAAKAPHLLDLLLGLVHSFLLSFSAPRFFFWMEAIRADALGHLFSATFWCVADPQSPQGREAGDTVSVTLSHRRGLSGVRTQTPGPSKKEKFYFEPPACENNLSPAAALATAWSARLARNDIGVVA
jgi:hypothetical protein